MSSKKLLLLVEGSLLIVALNFDFRQVLHSLGEVVRFVVPSSLGNSLTALGR